MSELLYEIADGVATITLNRPERRNAFTLEMLDLWTEALRDARTNEAVQAVVVTGTGDAFCSGGYLAISRSKRRAASSDNRARAEVGAFIDRSTRRRCPSCR